MLTCDSAVSCRRVPGLWGIAEARGRVEFWRHAPQDVPCTEWATALRQALKRGDGGWCGSTVQRGPLTEVAPVIRRDVDRQSVFMAGGFAFVVRGAEARLLDPMYK